MTPHIESKESDIANIVLMPGDPKRAEKVAREYLKDAKLVNTVRGMNAYTGYYNGKRVTVFPSGMGIPSMGIYSYELFKFYNVDKIIRIGTVGAYHADLNLYDLILVDHSYSKSNYAVDLDDNIKAHDQKSSDVLNKKIMDEAEREGLDLKFGNVYSTETFYDGGRNLEKMSKTCLGTEMESFALFANAMSLHKEASCILTVSDNLVTKKEIDSKAREQSLDKMIKLALNSI